MGIATVLTAGAAGGAAGWGAEAGMGEAGTGAFDVGGSTGFGGSTPLDVAGGAPSNSYWSQMAGNGASDVPASSWDGEFGGGAPGGGGMGDISFPQMDQLPPGSAADTLPAMSGGGSGFGGLGTGDLIRGGASLAGNLLGNRSTAQNSPMQMQAADRAWQQQMWNTMLGAQRPDQHTAWGDRTWSQDPKTGKWSQTDTLNPAEQGRLDSFRGIAQDRMNRASHTDLSAYDHPMDWASLGFGNLANAAGIGGHPQAAPAPTPTPAPMPKPMQQPIAASTGPMPDPSMQMPGANPAARPLDPQTAALMAQQLRMGG